MNVLVIYQSRNGHTRAAADAIAAAARQQADNVKLKSVIEVSARDIADADVVFIGTWVHGLILFNVRPAGAELWVPALPPLAGKPVGVFCTYAFNPRNSLNMLAERLTRRGAEIVGKHAFQRNHLNDGMQDFVERVLQAARQPA